MADPNYQPQNENLYGFSNGIPGIVGGSSTPLLQQARMPISPTLREGDGVGQEGGLRAGDPNVTPEQSAFFDAESAADRDARMGKVSDVLGKGITIGTGMLGIPGGSLVAGYGTGNGVGGWLASVLGGDNRTATAEQTASAYGQVGHSTGAYERASTTAGIDGDSNALGGAPAQADQAGLGGGGGAAPQGSSDGLGDAKPFAAGGLVTPASAPPMAMPSAGGAPPMGKPGLAPPGAPGAPTDPRMVDAQVRDLLRNKPEVVNKLQMMAQQAIQSGETTPEQIQQLGQIARVCLQNPAMYPRLVQMAEQRGIAPPGSMPQVYNEAAVKRLILLAAVVTQSPLGQPGMPGQEGGAPIETGGEEGAMEMRKGGMIRGRGTGTSDSIPGTNTSTGGKVKVSNGEYIIPAKVVSIKGREFFDNLLRKYSDVSGEGSTA